MTKAPKKTAKPTAGGTAPAVAPAPATSGTTVSAQVAGQTAAAPILGGDGSSAGAGIDPKGERAPEPKPQTPPVVTKPPKEPTAVEVVGPAGGRWRAGRHFTQQPVTIPLAELTDEQIDLLDADPSLTIRLID